MDSKNEAHFIDYSVKRASSYAVISLVVQTYILSTQILLAMLGYLYTYDLIARHYLGTITQKKCEINRLN